MLVAAVASDKWLLFIGNFSPDDSHKIYRNVTWGSAANTHSTKLFRSFNKSRNKQGKTKLEVHRLENRLYLIPTRGTKDSLFNHLQVPIKRTKLGVSWSTTLKWRWNDQNFNNSAFLPFSNSNFPKSCEFLAPKYKILSAIAKKHNPRAKYQENCRDSHQALKNLI